MTDKIKTLEEMAQEEFGVSISPKEPNKNVKEDKDTSTKVSFLETKDYILEQIKVTEDTEFTDVTSGEEGAAFVKYSKLNDNYEIVNEFEHRSKVYRPIIDDTLMKGGIHLPSGVKEYKDTKEIVDQITEFFKKYMELPTIYEKYFPQLVLFYWVYEKFPFVPYIQFVGRTATGKSTAMETFGSIAYKSIDTTGSLTIASIFRIATTWKGTLLIDEFENAGENSREIVSFLKAGVSDRLVLRTEGEVKKEVRAYVVKAPKLFTSENPIRDAGLQSRTIVVRMEKNKRLIPLFRLPHYYKEAEEIRNKLLLWRLRNYNKIVLKDIEFGFKELEGLGRRVQQIVTPIYYLADDKTKESIIEFAKEQQEETFSERRESFHGMVFSLMMDIWGRNEEAQIKNIASLLNSENKSKNYEITPKKVSNTIRKILSYNTEVRGDDKLAWVVKNSDKTLELCAYYGIKLDPSSPVLTSVNPVTPVDDNSFIFDDVKE